MIWLFCAFAVLGGLLIFWSIRMIVDSPSQINRVSNGEYIMYAFAWVVWIAMIASMALFGR